MKTKKIAKFLGLGLAIALAASLGLAALPASAGVQEWDTITTPSWEDHVIEPGSDIFDYAVGPDGETIYATGAKTMVDVQDNSLHGLTGSFVHGLESGEVTLTKISDSLMEIEAWLEGDTNYLLGDFTFVTMGAGDVELAAITGTITGDPSCGDDDDMMEFSGYLYSSDGDFDTWPEGTGWVSNFNLCVEDFIMYGGMTINPPIDEEIELMGVFTQPRVWKSTDAGVTWTDITADVQDAENLPGPFIALSYGGVAVAPDDEDWVAVGGIIIDPNHPGIDDGLMGMIRPAVVASQTGGSFSYAGDVEDTSNSTAMALIYDIAVSPEVDGIHNIALGGVAIPIPDHFPFYGAVYRLEAGTWLTGSWDDTTFYDGWDNGVGLGIDPPLTDAVIACDFSKNFDIDDTILCMGVNGGEGLGIGHPYLQSGTWGSDNSWNDEAGFPEAAEITVDGDGLMTTAALRSLGLAVPADYDGTDPGSRSVFIYANGWNEVTELVGGYVMRVDDGSVSEPFGPSGDPLLASIAFHGDADTGKMMIGERLKWDNAGGYDFMDPPPPGWGPVDADCCEGVRVWHTVEMDPCCPDWELACKNPSGPYMAVVAYSPDGEKAFATTSGILDLIWSALWWLIEDPFPDNPLEPGTLWGGLCDESAFSVSLDDGVSFNQIGLIDTDIDQLSDIAVCPDCSVIYMSSLNFNEAEDWWCEWGETCGYAAPGDPIMQVCECDSIWRSYDNGDTWERIYHGDWIDWPEWDEWLYCDDSEELPNILLRLPCEDTEECCTLYAGIQGTDELYYSRDCGQCWTQTPGTKIPIQDVAVAAENEVMVIDTDGYFSMSDQFGRRWSDEVDTEVGSGHVIESCCLDDLVVVAGASNEPVAFSEDMGETWELTDDLPGGSYGYAHVACDPNCPGTIYAAVNGDCDAGGIFRTTIDSGEWDDLGAKPGYYYGIEVARTGGALYAAYADECMRIKLLNGEWECYTGSENCTGVARNLDPCDTACCGEEDWDYLEAGLGECEEGFMAGPSSLKICGCLTMDTPSILWAIDMCGYYDVMEGSEGQIWSYEDCTAKKAPELVSPVCGEDIPSEPCEGCTNVDINLCWTNICDACTYDIEIATDEDFTQTIGLYSTYWDEHVDLDCYDPADCADPCFLIPNGALQAGTTYYWHVRVHGTETGENARSQWSETCSFNVMAGAGAGVSLLAPENGSVGIGTESVGFSWTAVGGATSYSFVLSPNSDLSGALASEELSSTAYTYTGMLDYSTPYFWQVTAWKNGSELSTSDVGAFTTADEPPPPPPAPEPATPPPDIVIPPAEQITPNWIIAVIAIGAALAVLVIVLIVRTRRP